MATRSAIVPIAALVALLFLASPSLAACTHIEEHHIALPTPTAGPPPHVDWLQGVNVVVLPVSPGLFRLESVSAQTCVGTKGVCLPDFNIAFYNGADTLIGNHVAMGDESGYVPPGAMYGVVWMRYGPDVGASDGSVFAVFRLSQGC